MFDRCQDEKEKSAVTKLEHIDVREQNQQLLTARVLFYLYETGSVTSGTE